MGFRIPHFQHFPPFASIIFLSFLIFQHPPFPQRVHGSPLFSRAALGSARGCKGRSPLHENNLGLPLPRRGRGSGGWGQEGKLKAGVAGDKEGKPPADPARQGQAPRRHHSGRAIRQPEPAPPIPPPSAPPQPSPQGRRQAPPPEASAGKTQAPARQPFRQQRREKIRSSTG